MLSADGYLFSEIASGLGYSLHDHDHLTAENVIMIVKVSPSHFGFESSVLTGT